MSRALRLVHAIDDLYRRVVADPEAWDEPAFADWLADVSGDDLPDRSQARHLRRAVRQAQKLARTRSGREEPAEWRSAVDEALGSTAWRPTLDLAQEALFTAPSEELFDEVATRFRVVHFRPWLDGLDYETWRREHAARPDANPGRSVS